jgi:hypothetical protein
LRTLLSWFNQAQTIPISTIAIVPNAIARRVPGIG